MTTTRCYSKTTTSNQNKTLYVGGIEESVNEKALNEIFTTFGDIKDIIVPKDIHSGKHRGYGFIEFHETEDAMAAIDNLHQAELKGKILRVNYAQKPNIKGGEKGWSHQPVWAELDLWLDSKNKNSQNL